MMNEVDEMRQEDSSRPTGQQQRKPVGRTFATSDAEVPSSTGGPDNIMLCREATTETGRQRSTKYCGA